MAAMADYGSRTNPATKVTAPPMASGETSGRPRACGPVHPLCAKCAGCHGQGMCAACAEAAGGVSTRAWQQRCPLRQALWSAEQGMAAARSSKYGRA